MAELFTEDSGQNNPAWEEELVATINIALLEELAEAIRRRDKTQVALTGMRALVSPVVDSHLDYIWSTADLQLERLNNPKYNSYFDKWFGTVDAPSDVLLTVLEQGGFEVPENAWTTPLLQPKQQE